MLQVAEGSQKEQDYRDRASDQLRRKKKNYVLVNMNEACYLGIFVSQSKVGLMRSNSR